MENTFLIIDDDVNIRKMLTLLIRQNNLGRVVAEIDSGEQAAEEIAFYNPDVVLVDLLLPVADGIEVINSAKAKGYNGKFIMISHVEEETMISKAYESGIVFFINKPINSIEAVNVIKGVCHSIELERSLALIKNAVMGVEREVREVKTSKLDEQIDRVFADLGIVGTIGSSDLKKVIHKVIKLKTLDNIFSYRLQDVYEEIADEEGGEDPSINKKAIEQRIRRTIQKAFETIAELGADDYSNDTFVEYSTVLFDFKQVRQQMRYMNGLARDPGKINIKKFIEGVIAKA